jgi:hypothetical protein
MSKKAAYILVFILIAIGIAFAVWKYTFRKSETSVISKKSEIVTTAAAILLEYETDEASANFKYLDKVVEVTGTVESINEDSLSVTVYLKESDSVAGVICSFDRTSVDLSGLSSGEVVRIKGICAGYLIDVVFNKCVLLSVM